MCLQRENMLSSICNGDIVIKDKVSNGEKVYQNIYFYDSSIALTVWTFLGPILQMNAFFDARKHNVASIENLGV